MDKKNTLKINLDELCSAMENSSFESEYYLDLATGEIILLAENLDDEDGHKLRKKIDTETDRFEPIPQAESRERYQDMQDFIATIKDEHLSELLDVAIDGQGAFRRFKDVLLKHPEERERWFKFSDGRMTDRALNWLSDIDVILAKE